MAGYEARAVVTADMSGFISAARRAATAAGNMATSVQQLNDQLARSAALSRSAGDALQPFANAARTLNATTRESANAGQELRNSMRDTADAVQAGVASFAAANDEYNRNTNAAREASTANTRLAAQIFRTEERMQALQVASEGNYDATRRNAQGLTQSERALATYSNELNRLEGQLRRKSEADQEAVDQQLRLLRANQDYTEVMRQTGREMAVQAGLVQRTGTELDTMGRRMERLSQVQGEFNRLRGEGVQLSDNELRSLNSVNTQLGDLALQYDRLTSAQRERVDRARAEAQATNLLRDANRQLAERTRQASDATQQQNTAVQASQSDINRLARQMEDYNQTLTRFQALQQSNGQLTAQQAESFRSVQAAAQQAQSTYEEFTAAERQRVDTARQNIAATRELTDSKQQLAAAERAAAQAGQQSNTIFNRNTITMFALRSAVGDLDSTLATIQNSLLRVGRAMAEAFTGQDVAIGQLARITQETDEFVNNLTESFRRMSTQIPVAFEELAEIGRFGSQVGIANTEMINFTRTVALFSATTNVAAEQAATMFARVQQLTGLAQNQIPNMGAAISALGSNSAATEGQILKMTEQISTVARQSELSATSVFGLAAALASLGVRPELARGALQRTLFEIEQAAQGASDRTSGLARAMNLTVEEMVSLRNSMSREDFFFTFLEGLERTREAGGDLNATLREVGFRNVQDIQVLSVLGTNWTQVANAIGLANDEFEANTFLQRESERLFERLTFQLQMTGNAAANLGARIVEAMAPMLITLANAATSALEWAAANDALVTNLARLAIIGGIVLTITALSRIVTFAAQGMLAWGTVLVSVRAWLAQTATVTAATTVATTANTVATTANTAAQGRMAAAMAASAAAARGVGAAMLAMAATNPVLFFTALAAVIITAAAAIRSFSNDVDHANQRLLDSAQNYFDAAGGVTALTAALQEDTKAWRENGESVALSVRSFEDVGGAAQQAALDTSSLAQRSSELSDQLDITGRSSESLRTGLQGAALSGTELHREMQQINPELQRISEAAGQTEYAVGAMALAFAQTTAEAALMESRLVESAEAFAVVQAQGIDFGAALAAEMHTAGAGAGYLRGQAQELRDQLSPLRESTLGVRDATSGWRGTILDLLPVSSTMTESLLFATDATEEAILATEEHANVLEAISLQMEISARAAQFSKNTMIDLGNGTSILVDELGDLNDESALLNATLHGTGLTVGQLQDSFSSLIDPLSTWQELTQEASAAADAADQSFTRLGADSLPEFNQRMSESEGLLLQNIDNLLRISEHAGPDVAQSLVEMGDAGVDMGFALAEALDTGDIDTFDEAVSNLGVNTSLNIESLVDSFARISGATGEARESAVELFEELNQQYRDGTIEFDEFVNNLATGLNDILGDTEINITAALDDSQMASDLARVADILEAWARDNGLEVPTEPLPPIDTTPAENSLREAYDGFLAMNNQFSSLFVSDIIAALASMGDPIATAFASDLAQLQQQYDEGKLTTYQFIEGVKEIMENADAVLELDLEDENARAELDDFVFSAEETASSAEAIVTPAVDGVPATGEMGLLTGMLGRQADEADPTVEPSVNRPPPETEMGNLITALGNSANAADPTVEPSVETSPPERTMAELISNLLGTASDADPTVEPTTNGRPAESQMNDTARTIEGTARSSDPTVTPRVDGGRAYSDMSRIMSNLRGQASSGVRVPVYPYQAGSISKSNLVRAADGGWISGPGGPREDRVPAWLSNGEFVVNARAARLWGSLLEDINGGAVPNMELRNARGAPEMPDVVVSPTGSQFSPSTSADLMRRVSGRQMDPAMGPQITVYNTYPQAEPTSTTINRSLQYATLLEGATSG